MSTPSIIRVELPGMEGNADVWPDREWRYALDRPLIEALSRGAKADEAEVAMQAAGRRSTAPAPMHCKATLPMGPVAF
jgi:hypothetical protein